MAQDQKVTLTFKMSDDTEKQVVFTVPGGKDGTNTGLPEVPKTVVDAATPMAEVQAAMLSLLQNPATAAANTQWNLVTYTNYPDQDGQVRLTVIPAETGKYLFLGGDLNYPGQGVASMAWVSDDGETIATMFESFHSGPQIDASLVGTGLFDELRVQLSQTSGNGLTLNTDGLFAAAGGLPGLPAAPLGDQITPAEFDQKVQDALARTTIPTEVTAEHYGMNVGDYGGFEAYLITIPVSGDGYYVLATGYVQEEPPTKWDMQGYVRVRDGAVDGNPTYIVNERTDMSLLLRTLNLYSSDGTVTITRELNDFNIKGKTLARGVGRGNFSFRYPDNKSAKNACGKMGTGVYWKVTIALDNAGAGNVAVIPHIWTNDIPCMEDGTLVPYQFVVDYIAANNNAIPTAAVWLICMGVPTHLMDVTSGALEKLQRADSGLVNGLDDLYPLAPDGEFAQEPQWRREYFYDAFKA